MSFSRAYTHWTRVQAIVAIAAGILAVAATPLTAAWSGLILAVWGPFAFFSLFAIAYRLAPETIGHLLPHAITAVRTAAAPALLALVWYHYLTRGAVPLEPSGQWTVFVVLLLVELSDLFDGKIARRLGASSFGPIWDMENDAYFALSLAVGSYFLIGMPPAVLAIGLMRYIYVIAARVEGDPPGDTRRYKRFAQVVAATLTLSMIASFAPAIPFVVRRGAIYTSLALQVISFSWDALLQLRAGRLAFPWQR